MTSQPDIFTNVHKGIRRALFAACTALGRAAGDADRERRARALLVEVLHFVGHHGENEDLLLLPLLHDRAPQVVARMSEDHAALDAMRAALGPDRPLDALYLEACAFTARYLAHIDAEERELEPQIRAVLSSEELAGFSRGSVERTAPADQRMMIAWMLPAMTRADVDTFLGRLPAPLASELRPLAEASA